MIEEFSGDFIQWLRGFYYVAKTKSFSRAGLEIGRNQSTISHQINCLEKEFGLRLIDRSGSKLALTPEGSFFLQKIISIFEQIKKIREYATKTTSILEGHIHIVSTQTVISYFLVHHVSTFIKKHPKVIFEVEGSDQAHILLKAAYAETDFAILNQGSVPKDFVYQHLFVSKLVLIASKNFSYKIEEAPTLMQIAKLPFISFIRTCSLYPIIEKQFSKKGLKLNTVVTLNNFETVKLYVAKGIGVSIMEDYSLNDKDKEVFDIFPLVHLYEANRFGIIIRKRKYLSPSAKAFLETIKPDIQVKNPTHRAGL